MTGHMHYSVLTWYHQLIARWETSAKVISGRLRRGHPGKATKIAQQT